MARRLVCYKDVWETESGTVFPVAGLVEKDKHPITKMIDCSLEKLKETTLKSNPQAYQVGGGSMALSFMIKLYTDRDSYNKSSNVYQSIPFKYKPSKALISELLISTGNKFAHLEYVMKHEETYEVKGELK